MSCRQIGLRSECACRGIIHIYICTSYIREKIQFQTRFDFFLLLFLSTNGVTRGRVCYTTLWLYTFIHMCVYTFNGIMRRECMQFNDCCSTGRLGCFSKKVIGKSKFDCYRNIQVSVIYACEFVVRIWTLLYYITHNMIIIHIVWD